MKLLTRQIAGIKVLEVTGDVDAPVIILFHGYGSDAYDLISLGQAFPGTLRPTWLFPEAPLEIRLSPDYVGHAWFPIDFTLLMQALSQQKYDEIAKAFPTELLQARQFGNHLIAELNIPLSNLFIGGFSQGAILATELALWSEKRPAGLILLSTTLIHEAEWKKKASHLEGLPFFQSHGKRDSILPFSLAQKLEQLLNDAGLIGSLKAFEGGHEIPPSVLSSLAAFLDKQKEMDD